MKKLHVVDVYKATINSDSTEGRGYEVLVGYFTNEEDARKAVKGQDTMGSDGRVTLMDLCVEVYETYKEYQDGKKRDLKARALAKLTPQERVLLGLE